MIKNIIFDFGGILIPLDESKTWDGFKALGANESLADDTKALYAYEKGEISTAQFLKAIKPHFFRKKVFARTLVKAWNAMLLEIPEENIQLVKQLKHSYRIFMLSNTNELHIQGIKDQLGPFKYKQLYRQFEKVYYSYEVGMRKPDAEIFEKVLTDNELEPAECLYIEDGLKNIEAAKELGIQTWHFKPGTDAILDLDKVLSKHH